MSRKPPPRAMGENPTSINSSARPRNCSKPIERSSPKLVAEVNFYHRTATPETSALHDAQFVLARSYVFESRPKLNAAVDGVASNHLRAARPVVPK